MADSVKFIKSINDGYTTKCSTAETQIIKITACWTFEKRK